MPIPHERYKGHQRPGHAEQLTRPPFSHYAEQVKAEIARNPLQVGIPPKEILQRSMIRPGVIGTAFATDGTLADALDARTSIFDKAFYERTQGKRENYIKDEVAQGLNRVVTVYDALTYDQRSPSARYQMQHRGYSPASQALDPSYERITDTITLQPQESDYVIWSLNTVGIAHTLQPGVNEVDIRPFLAKLVTPDQERDEYAEARGEQLTRSTIPHDVVQGIRLQVGEVADMAEQETTRRRVTRVFSLQWERQRRQHEEELQKGTAA